MSKEKQILCSEICCTPTDELHFKNRNSCSNGTWLEKAKHPLTLKICYCLWGLLGHCCSAWSCCLRPSTPGLHHSHFPAVRIKVGTSAEHLVADSLPTLTVKNNLIIELNPVRPRVYIQNPRARPPLKPWQSPPALVCTSNSDMAVARKSSSLGDPCPLFS